MAQWVRIPGKVTRQVGISVIGQSTVGETRLAYRIRGESALYSSYNHFGVGDIPPLDVDFDDEPTREFLGERWPGSVDLPDNQPTSLLREPPQNLESEPLNYGDSIDQVGFDLGSGSSVRQSSDILWTNNLSGRITFEISEANNFPVGTIYTQTQFSRSRYSYSRPFYRTVPGATISADYQIWNRGRPGDSSILTVNNISGADAPANLSVTPGEIAKWQGPDIQLSMPVQDSIGYVVYNQNYVLYVEAANLPPVIPVTPETPSPAPNPVLPMPSVPPVMIPPPPAPTPPPPTEDMAVPPAPVVPRPIAVVDSTPGLAPNVPVIIRDFIGSPTMPLTRPKAVPNPYSGSGSSASSSSGSSRAPRSAPTPVPV